MQILLCLATGKIISEGFTQRIAPGIDKFSPGSHEVHIDDVKRSDLVKFLSERYGRDETSSLSESFIKVGKGRLHFGIDDQGKPNVKGIIGSKQFKELSDFFKAAGNDMHVNTDTDRFINEEANVMNGPEKEIWSLVLGYAGGPDRVIIYDSAKYMELWLDDMKVDFMKSRIRR